MNQNFAAPQGIFFILREAEISFSAGKNAGFNAGFLLGAENSLFLPPFLTYVVNEFSVFTDADVNLFDSLTGCHPR